MDLERMAHTAENIITGERGFGKLMQVLGV